MDYKARIIGMLEKLTDPKKIEKIYWYVQRILVR